MPPGATTGVISVTTLAGTATGPSFTVSATGPVISGYTNLTSGTGGSCGNNVTYPNITTSAGSLTFSQNSNTFFPIGVTTVIATATSGSCISTIGFNVTVTDNTPPTIASCPSNISLSCVGVVNYSTPTVTDNCGGSVNQSITFNYSGSIVNYTIPAGIGQLTITAKGGQGGQYGSTNPGGFGASVSGTFNVTPGQILSILVGQQPACSSCFPGGGGGSFVALGASYTTATPMLVAGGGGGSYSGGAGQGDRKSVV